MTTIVTDAGFTRDTWDDAVELPSDITDAALARVIAEDPPRIRVAFPSFADGRGFTIARILRQAALAAGQPAAAAPVLDWMARTGIEDVSLHDLRAQLARLS